MSNEITDAELANMISKVAHVRGRLKAENRLNEDKDFTQEIIELEDVTKKIFEIFEDLEEKSDED